MNNRSVIIATRGSKLAIFQAQKVKEELEKKFHGRNFIIKIVKTKGDKILDVALSKIGEKGLFTKELEVLLLNYQADLAVHSLKDMPTDLPEGLIVGGVLERGDVRDALVTINGKKLIDLNDSDIVATSSLRRKAQLMNLNRMVQIVDIRGNVETRLKKMEEGYCTALIMAVAGLQRLGYETRISEILDPSVMLPAVSQGAIGIEIRTDDDEIGSMIRSINNLPTYNSVIAERTFLKALDGGCQIPIGCYTQITPINFMMTGFVSNTDGSVMIKNSHEGKLEKANDIALELAQEFIAEGAGEIIQKIRTSNNI